MERFRLILLLALLDQSKRIGYVEAFSVQRLSILGPSSILSSRRRWSSWKRIRPRRRKSDAPLFQHPPELPAWSAGNVEEDFRKLECAIKLAGADFNLEQAERREILETMAKQRYSIHQTARKNFLIPTLVSIMISLAFRYILPASLIRAIHELSNLHFWTLVVGAPITVLLAMKQSLRKSEAGYESQQHAFSWRKPQKIKSSCENHVLCLVEQWGNAVLGMALFGWAVDPTWQAITQTTTRIAASMSLRQFPLIWHRFKFDAKPTAQSRWRWALNTLCTGLCPVAFSALAIAEIAYEQSWAVFSMVYGPLVIGSTLALLRWPPPRKKVNPMWSKCIKVLLPLSYVAAVAFQWQRKSLMLALGSRPTWQSAFGFAANFTSLILPICHIIAFCRLVQIRYMDDVPLTSSVDQFRLKISESHRLEWRWRLHWREPLRMSDAIKEVRSIIFRSLLVKGSVEEQVDRERRSNRLGEVERRKMNILQIVERERNYVRNDSLYNSTQWKEGAMNQVKEAHKGFHAAGKDIDALGQALYKTYDIGLGFEFAFDLFDPTNKEPPKVTTRLLQARAARSAIARARELYKNENIDRQLEGIDDPLLREGKRTELMKKADNEMQYMRGRLLELIPTDMPLNFRSEPFNLNHNTGKQGSSIWNLKKRDQLVDGEIDYLNPGGIPDLKVSRYCDSVGLPFPPHDTSSEHNRTKTTPKSSSLDVGKSYSSQATVRNYVNPHSLVMNRTFDGNETVEGDPTDTHTIC